MTLLEILCAADRPEIGSRSHTGGAIQLWEDGEITYQKSGDLLWMRTLHSFNPPLDGVLVLGLPHTFNGHGFIFVESHERAKELRQTMLVKRGNVVY